jgi:hypothetical protein
MMPWRRRRLNGVALCANIFLPWLLFAWIYCQMTFTTHYLYPHRAHGSVIAGFAISFIMLFLADRAKRCDADPMWYTYAGLACLIGTILAGCFGDLNYSYNMQPYYDMDNLNTYPSVNPAAEKGQALMDAGRAYFVDGAGIDTKKSLGFKNEHLYCVAPITYGNHQLASYDFWAVGVNCCSGTSSDFRCGEYNNPHARAGLRLLREDQRPFFKLAVQMAEAAYNIKSTHPLFFYWLQDPVAELNTYRDDGHKYFLIGVASYFFFNAFCVTCAVWGFSKIGSMSYGY